MKYQELGTSGIMVSKVSLGAWGLGGGSVWSDKTSTVADTMVVRDEKTGRILLIQQYGRPSYVLVAGYVNRGEQAEQAVVREIKEETGMTVARLRFNRTKFFAPSNTLMVNFTAYVSDATALHANEEIDRWSWFTPEQARENIRPGSLAEEFLNAYLDECGIS